MEDHYFTIEKPSFAEFKERGSRFIAYAYPIADVMAFKERLTAIKKEHPKATHHCFAYRIGLKGTNYRVSDDGEPSGSAGRPILGQIDIKNVTNILIIVVRYFGGTQLGMAGLINAYKTSAALALQLTPIIQQPIRINCQLQFDYTLMNDIMRIIKQYECIILEKETNLFCLVEIGIPKISYDEVLNKLKKLRGVEVHPDL